MATVACVLIQVIAKEVRTDSNMSSTAVVTIYVTDANDNQPQFNVSSFTIPALSELTQSKELIARMPLVSVSFVIGQTNVLV